MTPGKRAYRKGVPGAIEGGAQKVVADIVRAFASEALRGYEALDHVHLDGDQRKQRVGALLAFKRFRDLWRSNGTTRRVLDLVKDESKSTPTACVVVQKLFLSCLQNVRARSESGVKLGEADKFLDVAKQCAGIYAAHVIYAIQPVHPKVRIYLPYSHAEELYHALWDLRKDHGLYDCHKIALHLAREDSFVFGGLRKEKGKRKYPQRALYPQKQQRLSFEMWKEAKQAEALVKSCLDNVEATLDKDLVARYNKGLSDLFGEDFMASDLVEKVAKWQSNLKAEVQGLLLQVGSNITKPAENSYYEVFGGPRVGRKSSDGPESASARAGTSGAAEGDDKDGLGGLELAVLPPKWRKKIKDAMAQKEANKSQKKGKGKGRKRKAPQQQEDFSDLEDGQVEMDEELALLLEAELA